MYFTRKASKELLDWKEKYAARYAVLLEGARRVGKSTIAEQFAINEYKSYISKIYGEIISVNITNENITYINPPVSDVFKSFLTQTKLINSNIKLALESLKVKIDNDVFREWIDAVIACQEDKNLKKLIEKSMKDIYDGKDKWWCVD